MALSLIIVFDPGATLSFVTPLVSRKFDILLAILNEPFMVTASVGESVVEKRVHRNFPKMLPDIIAHVELVKHD